MKTLDQLNADHAAAVAKLEAEHAIAKLCPTAPDYIGLSRKRAPYVVYRKWSLSEALDVLDFFRIVPFWKYRGTFVELVPEGMNDGGTEEAGPFALMLTVVTNDGGAPSADLKFFAPLADGTIAQIGIDIEGPGYIGAFQAFAPSETPVKVYHGNRSVIEWRIGPNGTLAGMADSYVQYATGDKKSSRFCYLFAADEMETLPAAEMTHALGMLRNLRDEFQPPAVIVETTANAVYWRLADGSHMATKAGEPAPKWGHGYTLEFCKSVNGDAK